MTRYTNLKLFREGIIFWLGVCTITSRSVSWTTTKAVQDYYKIKRMSCLLFRSLGAVPFPMWDIYNVVEHLKSTCQHLSRLQPFSLCFLRKAGSIKFEKDQQREADTTEAGEKQVLLQPEDCQSKSLLKALWSMFGTYFLFGTLSLVICDVFLFSVPKIFRYVNISQWSSRRAHTNTNDFFELKKGPRLKSLWIAKSLLAWSSKMWSWLKQCQLYHSFLMGIFHTPSPTSENC